MNIKYEKNIEIELKLLKTIEENKNISQRSISKEINVALGLTNSLVKKFVKKGFLKLKQAPMKRFLYYLTPQGLIEKSRLTQEYIKTSLTFFKRAKQDFEEIFKLIQKDTNSSSKEMYEVFNMGHRMEIYCDPSIADDIISISKAFQVDAKIIGHVENSNKNSLIIQTEEENIEY